MHDRSMNLCDASLGFYRHLDICYSVLVYIHILKCYSLVLFTTTEICILAMNTVSYK